MAQGFPGSKFCPQCNKAHVIDAPSCSNCGHVFRTKFVQPQMNQTMGFPGIPMPGVQPPPGINPQNIITVDPYGQPLQAPRRGLPLWGHVAIGVVLGCIAICGLGFACAVAVAPSSTSRNGNPDCKDTMEPLPCVVNFSKMSETPTISQAMNSQPVRVLRSDNPVLKNEAMYYYRVPNPRAVIICHFEGEKVDLCYGDLLARSEFDKATPVGVTQLPPMKADDLDGFYSGPRL